MRQDSQIRSLRRWSHGPIPDRTGVGLKPEHYDTILETRPDVGWFEVHPENYMGQGGAPHHYLTRIRARYPISFHGVGLSIGSAAPIDKTHLSRLAELMRRYEPAMFSEHLAWSTHDGAYLNDLLPLPYTRETLDVVCRHVDEVQTALSRRMLLENPSTYVAFAASEMSETEFLGEIARRTGCGLLLDVNNVFVSATNNRFDADAYIDAFPAAQVGEIHLGGHADTEDETGAPLLIDVHDREVKDAVWALFRRALARTGAVPTLIEWDNDVPAWSTLYGEAVWADAVLDDIGASHGKL
jgi:uncharacterized protein (UPF0276 family)